MTFETILTPATVEEYTRQGFWRDRIITDFLDAAAARTPDKPAAVDSRGMPRRIVVVFLARGAACFEDGECNHPGRRLRPHAYLELLGYRTAAASYYRQSAQLSPTANSCQRLSRLCGGVNLPRTAFLRAAAIEREQAPHRPRQAWAFSSPTRVSFRSRNFWWRKAMARRAPGISRS